MNQLFQQLNQQLLNAQSQPQSNPVLSILKQKFNQVKMMTDPIGYINNMPEMKNVVNMVNQNGGNAKQVFYNLAQQKGVDPNTILDMFK